MESRTKNRKTRQQLEKMAKRAFGGVGIAPGGDAVQELKEGWFNVAYDIKLADGRNVILKIAPPEDAEIMAYEKNIMETEVSSMRLVRSNPAIPVPEIYFYDQARDLVDADYFFMERLHGENLERAKGRLPPDELSRIMAETGRIVREINGFKGAYFGYPGNRELRADDWPAAFELILDSVLEDGRRKGVDYRRDRADIREAALRHFAALDEVAEPRLVHWDAWDSNFFVAEGKVTGLLDFERALWGDPLMEAQFRPFSGIGPTDARRGYEKTELTLPEEKRCKLYDLHLALILVTECAYRCYDTDAVRDAGLGLLDETMGWLSSR